MGIQYSHLWPQTVLGRTKAFKKTNPGLKLNSTAKNVDVFSILLKDHTLENPKCSEEVQAEHKSFTKYCEIL